MVLSELATMTEVAQGTSLARFGHGELAIMKGKDAKHQKYDRRLRKELLKVWRKSPCLLAYPHTRGERGWEWKVFLEKYGRYKGRGWYGSALVSRHDEMPWTDEYRRVLHKLWEGRYVDLVGTHNWGLDGAKGVRFVDSGSSNSFNRIDEIENKVHRHNSTRNIPVTWLCDLVILCCGPTGTVLADRLARNGIWAVDLGNFGKFL